MDTPDWLQDFYRRAGVLVRNKETGEETVITVAFGQLLAACDAALHHINGTPRIFSERYPEAMASRLEDVIAKAKEAAAS